MTEISRPQPAATVQGSEPIPGDAQGSSARSGPSESPNGQATADSEQPPRAVRSSDRDLWELDDRRDRDELRSRYYGLLQELRVVLPGVQVLLAFLLAVPFAPGFAELDTFERGAFGVAILAALLAVISMLTPAAMHRFGERTARRARLTWSIRMTMAGLAFLALALIAALWTVAKFVYGTGTALLVTVPVSLAIPTLWWLLPRQMSRQALDDEPAGDGAAGDRADDRADDRY
jgi:hypothetical protein